MHAPSAPFPFTVFDDTLPFHMWDFYAASEIWDRGLAPYTPSAEDVAYGDVVRSHWLSIAFNGTAGEGWDAVSAGGSYATGLLDANGTTMAPLHKQDTCQALASVGIDVRFWWVN